MNRTSYLAMLLIFLVASRTAHAWRSSLYPEGWTPPSSASFSTDKLIQDFSYAGYRRGEESVPTNPPGSTYNVTNPPYNADNTGSSDATAAIQQAIDAAGAAGGGIVYLPAGTYNVDPGASSYALQITSSDVVLRGAGAGQTYILNTTSAMRSKAVIKVSPGLSYGSSISITNDLDSPTRRLPVSNASAFSVGDKIRIQWDFTQEWIDEHNQGTWWSGASGPSSAKYMREVTAVNTGEGWIEVDIPTRYAIKTRDNPRIQTVTGMLSGIGIEDLSIGNVQHAGTGFAENDYNVGGTAAYDAHASWLISLRNSFDCWISGVESFQPAGNTSTCHMLSNGIGIIGCFRVTVKDCSMQRSQFGGGGGNGYMYRVQTSNDNLLQDCLAHFSRHGFVISHAGTSGNVFRRCTDSETKRSTGNAGSYTTNGSGSDHHMHFSHSNLYDDCLASNSFWTAHHRGTSGSIPHALTSAHSTYWNIEGAGTRYTTIVQTEQGRYGYVIGTSGAQSGASNPTGGNTAPADHLEGIGTGSTLTPQSLYGDQLTKRLLGVLVDAGADSTQFTTNTAVPLAGTLYTYGDGPVTSVWSQVSGPAATFVDTNALSTTVACTNIGTFVFRLTAWDGPKTNQDDVIVTVLDSDVATLVSKDYIIGESDGPALTYYPDGNANVVGLDGGTGSKRDRNVVLGYSLPTIAAGSTVTGATFSFEITAARDAQNLDPSLQVYMLNTANPDSSGTNFFYQGPSNTTANAKFIGSHYLVVGTAETNYPDDLHDIQFTLTGDALSLLQSYYGGDNVPDQSEVFFRFNLDQDPTLSQYIRYRIDLANDESVLEILGTDPPPPGAIVWSDQSTAGITGNSAWGSATVNTNLTGALLVWDTADNGTGSTNDWPVANRLDLGARSAGTVTGQLSSLSADTVYSWRFYGDNATTSGWSSAGSFASALTAAQAPAFTNATSLSASSIQLGWQDNASTESDYVLQRSTNAVTGYAEIATLASNTVTHIDTGLDAGTTYYYRLAATNNSNGSATGFSTSQTNAATDAVFEGLATSKDSIVGRRMTNATAIGYYVDAGNALCGTTGSAGAATREDRTLILGFSLPVLPAGTTVSNATLNFEITAARDQGNDDPSLHVYVLNTGNPDGSGTNYFYHGPSNTTADAKFVGSTYIDITHTSSTNYPDDLYDQAYLITGDALSLLQGFYGGDNVPDQAEVFFRFNLDVLTPTIDGVDLDRYYIDLAADESSLQIEATTPTGDDTDGDGMSDAWEIAHFGSLTNSAGTGSDDQDGDGFIDLHEYLAGTIPTNSASLLAVTQGTPGASTNEVVLTWLAVTNKTYIVLSTEDLTAPWITNASGIAGTEPTCVHTAVNANAKVFYRIGLQP